VFILCNNGFKFGHALTLDQPLGTSLLLIQHNGVNCVAIGIMVRNLQCFVHSLTDGPIYRCWWV